MDVQCRLRKLKTYVVRATVLDMIETHLIWCDSVQPAKSVLAEKTATKLTVEYCSANQTATLGYAGVRSMRYVQLWNSKMLRWFATKKRSDSSSDSSLERSMHK